MGEYQIVILGPKMLQTCRFTDRVLCKTEFQNQCLAIFVDEAHCVSHWGADFRKKYATLGMLRAFISNASFVAVSTTFTSRVKQDVLRKLQFGRDFLDINIGNDQPNIAQVVHTMEHPMNSFRDLNFLIPSGIQHCEDIPKAFVYYDAVNGGIDVTTHLNLQVPEELHHLGLVCPYNAAMSQKYQDQVMRLFKAGVVHILVCMDATGMVS